MTPNPIRKVLSTMRGRRVRFLLAGGQACVFYGAAEFSRDTDIVILADAANLARLKMALADLQAECIAVPPFDLDFLRRGHAVHFRCHHPAAVGMRLDVMSVLRGVEPFPALWKRRTTIRAPEGDEYQLLSLPDLVCAKKTQRDKDWPMIRRLVEANYAQHQGRPNARQNEFWLREGRTESLLIAVARRYPDSFRRCMPARPLLALAQAGAERRLTVALRAEEERERAADRTYWTPLKAELEALRHPRG